MTALPPPELSRPLPIDRIGSTVRLHALEANAAECAAVAKRLGIEGVTRLSARFAAEALPHGYRISGPVTGEVTVACVITLKPVSQLIETRFDAIFLAADESEFADEIELTAADCEIDSLVGGQIDLGECAVQALAVAIDYVPRAPGAEAIAAASGILDEAAARELSSPFSIIKPLK
jgi:uncharacterized metal-binding protein YceD (DUF177 family)